MSQKEEESKKVGKEKNEEDEEEEEEDEVPGSTLFIKNLNFSTTEETLREVGHFRCIAVMEESEFLATYQVCFISYHLQTFTKCGNVRSCTIAKKKDKTGMEQEKGEQTKLCDHNSPVAVCIAHDLVGCLVWLNLMFGYISTSSVQKRKKKH